MPTADFVPGVSASVNAGDAEIGFAAPIVPYDGTLETDWATVGTNTRLQAIDSVYVAWNTIALGTTSRRLDLSTWTNAAGGASLASTIPANATVSGFSILIDGKGNYASSDYAVFSFFAGLRQQSSGGIVTPPDGSSSPQFFGTEAITNASTSGDVAFATEIGTTDALGGLSAANALTMLRTSTLLMRVLISNDTSSANVTISFDEIRLRVAWTLPATTSSNTRRSRSRDKWRVR